MQNKNELNRTSQELARNFLIQAYALYLYSHRHIPVNQLLSKLMALEKESLNFFCQAVDDASILTDDVCQKYHQELSSHIEGVGLAQGLMIVPIGAANRATEK